MRVPRAACDGETTWRRRRHLFFTETDIFRPSPIFLFLLEVACALEPQELPLRVVAYIEKSVSLVWANSRGIWEIQLHLSLALVRLEFRLWGEQQPPSNTKKSRPRAINKASRRAVVRSLSRTTSPSPGISSSLLSPTGTSTSCDA
jgi:hypothetical protein